MASFIYNEAAEEITKGTLVWTSDTIKARLVASSASPNKDDTAMTGFTAIGTDQTLSNKSIVKNTTDDRAELQQSAALTWTAVAAGSTVGFIIVYKFVTDDAGSTPIACIDVDNVATNGGDLTWTPASNVVAYTQQ
jgi:hypothetical protein